MSAVCAAALAPASARAQPPGPVAEERLDIDGDGTLDLVRLEQPPGVSVVITGDPAGSTWLPLATSGLALTSGTITTARGPKLGGGVVIAVEAVFADRRARPRAHGKVYETVVVAWRGGVARKIWQGKVGAQGRDGEYSERIEATADGLLRFQRRADVRRCDGAPARLFPQRWDFRAGRFRSIYGAARLPANAIPLRATRAPPPGEVAGPAGGYPAPAVFRAQAASTQAGARHAGELTAPREIDDGRADTAWREDLGGDGRGEFVTATTTMRDHDVVAVRVIPGDAASARAFARANRLKRVGLLVGDRAFTVEFATDPGRDRAGFARPWWIVLPEPVRARCASLVIAEVYPGSGARGRGTGVTAISELAVLTSIDLTPGGAEAQLAARAAKGGRAGMSAAHALAARGPAGVGAVLDALDGAPAADARTALLRALALIVRPGRAPLPAPLAARAAAALAAGLAAPATSTADRDTLTAALVVVGSDAVAPLAALLGATDGPPATREAAAAALSLVPDPAAGRALLAAAGDGPRPVRRAVARALGTRADELPAVLAAVADAEQQGQSAREADLWRALGTIAAGADPGGADIGSIAAAMGARLAAADGYELRYRLFAATGAHGDAAALAALGEALARARGGPRADALRRVAARALGDNQRAEARALLVGLADDPDPGARKAALTALAGRADRDEATERALTARLAADPWPRIRQLAADGLALSCAAATPAAALRAALDDDADARVRRAAIAALVACRADGIADLLVAVARSRAQPTTVRVRAIALMSTLGDPSLAAPLTALFASYRRRVWSGQADALELAQAAAAAMGAIGGPAVVAPLLQAARDPTFPEIQAAAVIGLGILCPPQARQLMAKLSRSGERQVSIAARRAAARCRK